MLQLCKCGNKVELTLHKVLFAKKIEISHVPVFHCEACDHIEVYDRIKQDLQTLVKQLANSDKEGNYQVSFREYNEVTNLLLQAVEKEDIPIDDLQNNRVNELLDLLLLARSLDDQEWAEDTSRRLKQITGKLQTVNGRSS